MEEEKIYYRCNLPHYQPSHASYFITLRITGSLPNEVIITLKEEYEDAIKQVKTNNPKWLSDDSVAQIVADSVLYYAESRASCN